MKDPLKTLGTLISKFRGRCGWSESDLGARVGRDESWIRRVEGGRSVRSDALAPVLQEIGALEVLAAAVKEESRAEKVVRWLHDPRQPLAVQAVIARADREIKRRRRE